MDEKTVKFNSERFEEIKTECLIYLLRIGYKMKNIQFIPISGHLGDNLVVKSDNMPWNHSVTLIEALNKLKAPKRPIDKHLRVCLQAVYRIGGIGTVPLGRVATGILKVGDTVKFTPSNLESEVGSMEMHHETRKEGIPGDLVGFNVKGLSVK